MNRNLYMDNFIMVIGRTVKIRITYERYLTQQQNRKPEMCGWKKVENKVKQF